MRTWDKSIRSSRSAMISHGFQHDFEDPWFNVVMNLYSAAPDTATNRRPVLIATLQELNLEADYSMRLE